MSNLSNWFGNCDICGNARKLIFIKDADIKLCKECDIKVKNVQAAQQVIKMNKEYDYWEYNNEDATIDIIKNNKTIDKLYIDSLVDLWACGEM